MKKAISMLLAAIMLFAMPAACFADAPAKPNISIAVNNIKDETMEVAINVGAGNFKSVGAVLEYDANKLVPIQWSTTTAINVPQYTTPAAGWAKAEVIESVCPDNLSGKPAMAYRNGDAGYLYLGAEAAAAQELKAATQVVTVRFAYLGTSSETRFNEAAATIKFADDKVAFASPVKGSMIYQTENRDTGEYQFYYLNPLTDKGNGPVPDLDVPGTIIPDEQKPDVTKEPEGETANKGEANTEDFVTLAFYDWDGTLLGTRIVAKGGSLIDPNTAENRSDYVSGGAAKYTDSELAALGVAPLAPMGETLVGAMDQNKVTITRENKAGYIYAGWVDQKSGYSTPYITAIMDAAGQTIVGKGQTLFSLSNITESRILKAAYDENATGIGANPGTRMYEISYSPFTQSGSTLETTVTVTRNQTTRRSNEGVVLVVNLKPMKLGQTRVRVQLGDSDVETYTVAVPLNAKDVYDIDGGLSFTVEDGSKNPKSGLVKISSEDMLVK